eukprot:CAMPEP_0194066790 /NCGR_PEP_ID=MMETSP0009_2-20130614/86216_1 /TAXON_ID=210454 /ORGANISM="Grammatophora oceanica, Strain CCMP 410" /LENGTH=263 /DNA_ID=CAMNT_0038719775 /DNA_START=108 /DNA_END=895 /DNA_ORIENTATION=-
MNLSSVLSLSGLVSLMGFPMSTHATSDSVRSLQANQSIVEIAVADPTFSTLVDLLTDASLVETLSGDGPFTVFAPTNDAFDAISEALETVAADTEALTNVLLYHVLSGEVLSTDLMDGMMAETVEGSNVTISIDGDVVKINDATVIMADVMATNGVIHVIDAVLLPPEDDMAPTMDIVEIAQSDPDTFSTLVTLLSTAGLVETLQGDGPFTVFAPTDDAFAAIAEALGAVSADVDAVTNVLLYHVLSGEVLSTDLMDGMMAET